MQVAWQSPKAARAPEPSHGSLHSPTKPPPLDHGGSPSGGRTGLQGHGYLPSPTLPLPMQASSRFGSPRQSSSWPPAPPALRETPQGRPSRSKLDSFLSVGRYYGTFGPQLEDPNVAHVVHWMMDGTLSLLFLLRSFFLLLIVVAIEVALAELLNIVPIVIFLLAIDCGCNGSRFCRGGKGAWTKLLGLGP